MKLVGMLACGLALSACASGPAVDYIRTEYTGVPVKLHTTASDEYRIFDKPEVGKLMITPSLAVASGMGVARAHGASDQSHFTKPWADAAADYLASTGRTCRIISTELLASPQYEVKYDCSAVPASPARPRKKG